MIKRENFVVIETQDIVDACDHIERAGIAIGEMLMQTNADGKGQQDKEDFLGDLMIVLCAAGAGAAVCKHQGGIVAMKEEATEEEKQEAARLLKELYTRNKTAPDASGRGGILQ